MRTNITQPMISKDTVPKTLREIVRLVAAAITTSWTKSCKHCMQSTKTSPKKKHKAQQTRITAHHMSQTHWAQVRIFLKPMLHTLWTRFLFLGSWNETTLLTESPWNILEEVLARDILFLWFLLTLGSDMKWRNTQSTQGSSIWERTPQPFQCSILLYLALCSSGSISAVNMGKGSKLNQDLRLRRSQRDQSGIPPLKVRDTERSWPVWSTYIFLALLEGHLSPSLTSLVAKRAEKWLCKGWVQLTI